MLLTWASSQGWPSLVFSLGNLALWLDADYSASIIKAGPNVTQWSDRSGNGRHASASGGNNVTVAAAGRLRRSSLEFDNARLVLGATYTPPAEATIYEVWTQYGHALGSGAILNLNPISTGTAIYSDYDPGTSKFTVGTTGPTGNYWGILSAVEPDIETPQIACIQKNAGARAARLNGVNYAVAYSAGAFGTGAFDSVGAEGAYPSKHRVGEILVFEAVHDGPTIARVEAYLAAKWIP